MYIVLKCMIKDYKTDIICARKGLKTANLVLLPKNIMKV